MNNKKEMEIDWGYAGLPLEAFKETKSDGKEIFVVMDEEGIRYEYKGPAHPESTTTLFGNWTGPAPFANDVPTRVKTRNGYKTSALDSFSMLYTIQCYDTGHHNSSIDNNYIGRISAALARGVITSWRNPDEFYAAMRIIQSFETSGHIFNSITSSNLMTYAASNAGIDLSSRYTQDALETFPLFELTPEEEAVWDSFLNQNGGQISIGNVDDLVLFLKSGGLEGSYMTSWFEKRLFENQQTEFAFEHIRDRLLNREAVTRSDFLPSWQFKSKSNIQKVASAVSADRIAKEITSQIIESLL